MSTRKRVSQACKSCNQKKIKCDGSFPSCGTCQNRNEECSYGISKRRGPIRRTEGDISIGSPSGRVGRSAASIRTPRNPVLVEGPDLLSSISPATSKRLFQTYFECIHPMWPLVYKPLYLSLDFASPSLGMPVPLILAILAIASCVDNTHQPEGTGGAGDEESYPKPQVFFEGALNALQQGTGSGSARQPFNAFFPSITNCQVLVILALQQHGVAAYSQAAMLCSLAAAMAIELRIHREYKSNDPVEREIRSRLWWNLYILEKMISGEQGRPVILRQEETDCSWPSISESDEFELMSPKLQYSDGSTQINAIKSRTMSALHTTLRLSMIMERIQREVYGIVARKVIRDDQNAGERLRLQLWHELQTWEKDLDASPLRLDLSDELTTVPPVVTNQVIMLTGTITLHRPFIARWPGTGATSPYVICLQAANRICLILDKYLARLTKGPCDMVFSIFTAAGILLQHSKQLDEDGAAEAHRQLKQCIHWLSVLGKSWKTAGARRQLLDDLFALPQSLQEPRAREEIPLDQRSAIQPLSQKRSPDVPDAIIQMSTEQQNPSPDDWSFLKDFGDLPDQFYSWDVELLDLLDGQISLEQGIV